MTESSPLHGFGSGTRGSWRSQHCSGSQWRQSSRSLVCHHGLVHRRESCRLDSWRSPYWHWGPTICYRTEMMLQYKICYACLHNMCMTCNHRMFPVPDSAFGHAWHRQCDIQGDLALASEDTHHPESLHLTAGGIDRGTPQICQLAEHNTVLVWDGTSRAAVWWRFICCKGAMDWERGGKERRVWFYFK